MALVLHKIVDEDRPMSLKETIKSELDTAERDAVDVRKNANDAETAPEASQLNAKADDECNGCDEAEIKLILKQMLAQRENAIVENEIAGKIGLVLQEQEEVEILREFLPKSLSDEELGDAAKTIVTELGATCLKDIGRCVSELKARYPEQIESGRAKSSVKKLLKQDCP